MSLYQSLDRTQRGLAVKNLALSQLLGEEQAQLTICIEHWYVLLYSTLHTSS